MFIGETECQPKIIIIEGKEYKLDNNFNFWDDEGNVLGEWERPSKETAKESLLNYLK